MKTRELILKHARQKGRVKTSEMARMLRISRQTIAQHLRELVSSGNLIKLGSTRKAIYVLPSRVKKGLAKPVPRFSARYAIRGLSEDQVFQEASLRLGLKQLLSPAAYKIVNYAFTEMLNNAIEHSKSQNVRVSFECSNGAFKFEVQDGGIGVFESIRKKFKFRNHFEAVAHLLKGKQTVDPKHHTGQGIFFTSKIADRFILRSAKLKLIVDNGLEDTFLEESKLFKGTNVWFTLKQRSRKDLKALFDEYSNDHYEFDRTRILVHLSEAEGEQISRSQAKRLLFGLEKFQRIVFDFKRVKGIGQGFADEIFRVFVNAHPKVEIETINMSDAVEFMVARARA